MSMADSTESRNAPQAVAHRICAWCKKDMGDVVVAANDPVAGKISHSICPECQARMLTEIETTSSNPHPQ